MPFIISAGSMSKENMNQVGGKAAHLGEMTKAGFPVPEAFFVTVDSWNKFLEENNLPEKIKERLSKTDFKDVKSLTQSSEEINGMIMSAKIPQAVQESIKTAYKAMTPKENVISVLSGRAKTATGLEFVALRSSAVVEDIATASSAGQYESFLNVRGEESVLMHVQKCWASFFTPRAMFYRHKHGQPELTGMGVVVQRMINSEKSGVTFTVDPTNPTDGSHKIITEAAWGLGETIVQGLVEPDYYVVDKKTGDVLEKKIGKKALMRIRDPKTGSTKELEVSGTDMERQVLTEMEIVTLAAYAKKIEEYYKGLPQDIEWAVEKGKIFILQTRAVTVLEKKEAKEITGGTALVEGIGASPGAAAGKVKIIRSLSELEKVEKGDILVTEMTSPDYVPVMEKSAAIVTNKGGSTSHAAIVGRELGLPVIVGTKNATQILKDGQIVTVDAHTGKIYEGEVGGLAHVEAVHEVTEKTSTEVKCNIAFPHTADRAKHADGVGLLRLEHMLTKAGTHPMEYVRSGRSDDLTRMIVEGVGKVAEAFKGKPVWVRTIDARTDEYRNMVGGEKEPKEDNPMLGWHGIRRDLDEPEIFKAQIEAFKQLHEKGHTDVGIMLPFIINVGELKKAKELAKKYGLPEAVKFGIMIETPAAAINVEEFCKEGIDFVSFGSNDLTQLTLGVDRNNERLIKYFNEMHPSMKFLFDHAIKTAKRYGVQTSICGELPSNREDAVKFLIGTGIDSVSVNIDAISKVRGWVARIEGRA